MLCQAEAQAIKKFCVRTSNVALTARTFSRSRATVKKVMKGVAPRNRRGRTSAARQHRVRLARQIARRNGKSGDRIYRLFPSAAAVCRQLAREFGLRVSRRTVQDDLVLAGGKSRVRPKHPTRNVRDRDCVRRFARRNIGVAWTRWCFSDETWVSTNEWYDRQQWIFGAETPFPREIKSRYNIPSCQVWLSFGHNWKGHLEIFPQRMNRDGESKAFRLSAHDYVRRCLSKVKHHLAGTGKILVQDGARSHVAKSVRGFAAKNDMRLTFDWPR